jgi:hypothetical protein
MAHGAAAEVVDQYVTETEVGRHPFPASHDVHML